MKNTGINKLLFIVSILAWLQGVLMLLPSVYIIATNWGFISHPVLYFIIICMGILYCFIGYGLMIRSKIAAIINLVSSSIIVIILISNFYKILMMQAVNLGIGTLLLFLLINFLTILIGIISIPLIVFSWRYVN